MELIKVVTCGSVDDGKSTLIGRIVFETNNILTDQSIKLKKLSSRYGSTGNEIDFSLLLDGLQDEREQGITIDVAHRYINFKNNRLVFHDSPGHNQYTRNVVTAASGCDIAILLIDVKKGILEQTKRHLKILKFLDFKYIIFAINKIDLIKFNKKKFLKIEKNLKFLISNEKKIKISFIPISALNGDNVIAKSKNIKWYNGKSILDTIISFKLKNNKKTKSYFTVQHVHRTNKTTRHYLGNLKGQLIENQKVKILPSNNVTNIKNIFSNLKKVKKIKDNPIAIDLQGQLDVTKGDVIIDSKNDKILVGNVFNAEVVITSKDNLIAGRQYLLRLHNKVIKTTVTKIKGVYDFILNSNINKNELKLNDIGEIEITCNDLVPYANFVDYPALSRFILVDEVTLSVVAAGKINFALRRSGNLFKTEGKVSKKIRSNIKRHKPKCIWFTGLSGSGKSTIAQQLEKELVSKSLHTYNLDGDNLRLGINKDLGFTSTDRTENIRRVAEISKLMVDAGLIVIVSTISPFRKDRDFAKSLFDKDEFYEVYISTPLTICMKRDPKKLYKKVKSIKNFNPIGLTSGYEQPLKPHLKIDTSRETVNTSVKKIFKSIFN